MKTMWKVVYGKPAPVEVQAEKPCYPHRDSDGDQIFHNTHFLNVNTAWIAHLAEHRARLSNDAALVEEARSRLAKREQALVDAALLYNAVSKAYGEFEARMLQSHSAVEEEGTQA